jgi:MFS family permease
MRRGDGGADVQGAVAPEGTGAAAVRPEGRARRGLPAPRLREAVGRWALATATAAIVLYWLSLYLYVPLLGPEAARLGAGVGGVGLVLAAYGAVQLVLRIPTGLWTDRLGRRRPFLLGSLLACGTAALGMGLARTPLWLGLFRGVSGLGACGWVAITLLFAELFPPARTAWALGLVNFLANGGQLVGMVLGGLLAQLTGGYAWSFFGAALLAALGLGAGLLVPEPAARAARRPASLAERLAVGTERGVLVASGLAVAGQYVQFATVFGFVPVLAATRLHAGGAALGVLSAAAGIPAALASLASGALGERWGGRAVAVAGFALAGAATALVPLAPGLAVLDAVAAVLGLGLGLNMPTLMAAAVQGFGPERRGTAMGFFQAIYSLGMMAGPALAGAVGRALGMTGLFETTAAVGLGGAVLAGWLLRGG